MQIPNALSLLAARFPVPLYIVGGAVRDSIAGFPVSDLDLAAAFPPKAVIALLKDTEYTVSPTSLKLGTLKIKHAAFEAEYTAFRVDRYSGTGNHAPDAVRFTKDIEEDACRRDFTVNAVYYDIRAREYVDPTGGLADAARGLLRTPGEPESIFAEDALRILRMVRIAAETGYQIEEKTYAASKKRVQTLQELPPERIREEFEKMLVADTKNGIRDAHVRAIEMMVEMGAMRYVLPELLEGIGMEQRPDFHRYDVYGHIVAAFRAAPPRIRLAALLHDIAKPRVKRETGSYRGHDVRGGEMTKEIMMRLRYPKREVERTARLARLHMYDLTCETGPKKLRVFVLRNADILDDLILLKHADTAGQGMGNLCNLAAARLEKTRDAMRAEGVPFSVRGLKVHGEDAVGLGIAPKHRGAALGAVLEAVARGDIPNERGAQMKFLESYRPPQ